MAVHSKCEVNRRLGGGSLELVGRIYHEGPSRLALSFRTHATNQVHGTDLRCQLKFNSISVELGVLCKWQIHLSQRQRQNTPVLLELELIQTQMTQKPMLRA